MGDNGARKVGGGAWGSTLENCEIINNSAQDVGGVSSCSLNRCNISSNIGVWVGGAYGSKLSNSTLRDNRGDVYGGAWRCTLSNCTVVGSRARYGWSAAAIAESILNNSIIYFNDQRNCENCNLNYCCTTPLETNGVCSITNAPMFVDFERGDLRLQSTSPCINAGNNAYVETNVDLDGNSRISGGGVDIGAYEFVFTPRMSIAQLMLTVESSDLRTRNKQPLLASLAAAMASFDRGNFRAGANQLAAFQNQVRAQVEPVDSAVANELVAAAQQIIDSATGAEERSGNGAETANSEGKL